MLSADAALLAGCPLIHKGLNVRQDLLIILGCKQQSGIKANPALKGSGTWLHAMMTLTSFCLTEADLQQQEKGCANLQQASQSQPTNQTHTLCNVSQELRGHKHRLSGVAETVHVCLTAGAICICTLH